jgi:hypothetical protein
MSSAFYASHLRHELSALNRAYAARLGLSFCESYGEAPVICYQPSEDGLFHGNFLPESYRAILKNCSWRKRLQKVHAQARTALPRNGHAWRELDSSNSSDALLMNIFCFPGTLRQGAVSQLLGTDTCAQAEFGVKARVPLANGQFDRTEIDMRVADLLVEAKLTESDFQSREAEILQAYRDFEDVFDRRILSRADGRYSSYQLIRNVLAAHASGCSFCVMCDARRPDLREAWYTVMRAVRPVDLRTRCKMITWQELAPALPRKLQNFLAMKYGIVF